MLELVIRLLRRAHDLRDRVLKVASSVELAEELWLTLARQEQPMDDVTRTRILVSMDQHLCMTGTQKEIEAAARRMSRRTGACVTVTVIVGHYHRRGCDEYARGGYTEEGD